MKCGKKAQQSLWFCWPLLLWVVGCSLVASRPGSYRPRLIGHYPLTTTYLPHLVKGLPHFLPPHKILVLLPLDHRKKWTSRQGEVPLTVRGSTISWAWISAWVKPTKPVRAEALYPVVGFLGTYSGDRIFHANVPLRFFPPDTPRLLFYTQDLRKTVQQAPANHLREVGFEVASVPFSHPREKPSKGKLQADYALGCVIKECWLRSLFYYLGKEDEGLGGAPRPATRF